MAIICILSILSNRCLAETDTAIWAKTRLIMGIYSPSITENASLSDLEISMNFWAKDFMTEEARKIGIEITESRAALFDNMQDMHAAFQQGELDMVVGPPLMLSRFFKSDELQDGFTALVSENRPESLLFIARSDKALHSIEAFKGKHIALIDNDELATMFLDSLFLKHVRQPVQGFVGQIDKQQKASRIVLDVYFNKVDGGVVYRSAFDVMVDLNPDIANKIDIVDQYPIKSRNFSFFSHNYPYAKHLSTLASGAFQASPRAKQILEVFKASEIAACTVSDLDAFEQFYQRYQVLKTQAK
jgi:phosphonate transport system substrate-binding protein